MLKEAGERWFSCFFCYELAVFFLRITCQDNFSNTKTTLPPTIWLSPPGPLI
jgi:hypothetical protein